MDLGRAPAFSRARFVGQSAAALVATTPAVASAQANGVLRVAGNPGDSYAESVYANSQDFFRKAGLNVDVQMMSSGSIIAAGVASGALEIGVSNIIPIALAYLRGIPFSFFASGGMYTPDGALLCVRADGPIRTGKDLNGQTVATSTLTDLNILAIKAWVDQNGGDSSTLRVIEVPTTEMAAALMRGTVSAAPLFEPFLIAARKAGGIRSLLPQLYGVIAKEFMISGYFARADWLAANKTAARQFANVIYDTGRWAVAHPTDSAAVLISVGRLDPDTAHGMVRTGFGRSLTPAMLQSTLDLAYKYKVTPRRIAAEEIITIV